MRHRFSWQRAASVARKESLHIFRDPATLFFALFIPILQMTLLGYAIDTNVRDLRLVVLDLADTQESRQLIDRFVNSRTFKVVGYAGSEAELSAAIVAGRAKVGVKIPADYSRQVVYGVVPAQVLILIDGSDSNSASAALNVANAILLQEDVALRGAGGGRPSRVQAYPRILFNPSTRSPNFFVPGLIIVMCQMMAVSLSANAIVREKENGTLEQLFMTPVRSGELILGKLLPYLLLTLAEFCVILVLMRVIFRVPIHGPVSALLLVALPFIFCFLGIGLWVSTRVATREAATQVTIGTMMPSIFLSGYIFPLDSMPLPFWCLAQVIPTTWLIDASRGVILRGATLRELWPHALVLWGMGAAVFTLSLLSFRKRL